MVIDLAATIPTQLPDQLREAANWAAARAGETVNQFDDNPYIEKEWLIVCEELGQAAARLEARLGRMI